ncbi:looped-hinge helix DNA binding domain-containing protein, AbrB family [Granulicella rosea]|uniref:Looped-hinge helix DNA binding domain-containing protein, AbrB family n=1 Tax=Granulicella rosea TaxID=474952 RepID=A0A239KL11_9BACT|nr:AbrB/MazE/SpoVT family DNA-binding domain-containing protein [Granulicella rosea]SNT18755.1 looped-hinge helix DNA binding domain-containing protein, AbrB family [Granulicella rosea]
METIKMGKRGTIVLPAKLRKQFGLEDGSLLNVDVVDGKISIRPAYAYEPEVWSDEERSYFILINSMTKEEWDRNLPDVLEMGIDPANIRGLSPSHRDTLPTEAEWDAHFRTAREKRSA